MASCQNCANYGQTGPMNSTYCYKWGEKLAGSDPKSESFAKYYACGSKATQQCPYGMESY